MTIQIATVLVITLLAVVLFITEKVRVDVVALIVLVLLALTGLVTPVEALSGFSNPAVVTVWAVLILSAGLSRTGVAGQLGERLIALANNSEARLVLVIMLAVGILSGFMNNIGVVAMMLPVVIDACRRMKIPPSRLLLPMVLAAHMGGMTTLIGTPPNILVSEALNSFGLEPFGMFDYTPTGAVVLAAGVLFLGLFGRRLLPSRDIARDAVEPGEGAIEEIFALRERLFTVKLPENSPLSGRNLGQSRLGSLAGVNVLAVQRNSKTFPAPEVSFVLQSNDCLMVGGSEKQLADFIGRRQLDVKQDSLPAESLTTKQIHLAEVRLAPHSPLVGKKLQEIELRHEYGLNVLAIWRDEFPRRTNLQSMRLKDSDVMLVQGSEDSLGKLKEDKKFLVSTAEQSQVYRLSERLMAVQVPQESGLVGKTLAESRLGDAYGLQVLGIERRGSTHLMPEAHEKLEPGDTLIVEGQPDDLLILRGLQDLELSQCDELQFEHLQSLDVGMVEVVLSPHSSYTGKTLREVAFREKYGLSVLAIWREGRPYRSNLRDMALKFGDALLAFGRREQLKILGRDREFLVLTREAIEEPRANKALLSLLIMAGVLLPVVLGWLNIAIAAVMGATLMVLTGCLTADEAYQAIEWRAIFLIAGMLPLGLALESTGAASLIANRMVAFIGDYGSLVVMGGIFLLTAICSQVIPNPAVAVLLAPIAFNTAGTLAVSPYPLMMTVAIGASAAFLSPVGHPANVLIMGPGGYRFSDYSKIGLPVLLVVFLVSMIIVPIVWPF